MLDAHREISAIPVEGERVLDENDVERVQFRDESVALLQIRIEQTKGVLRLARMGRDEELFELSYPKLAYDYDSLAAIFKGRGDRRSLGALRMHEYRTRMEFGDFARAEELKRDLSMALGGRPLERKLFEAAHALATWRFDLAEELYRSAKSEIKRGNPKDLRLAQIDDYLLRRIPEGRIEHGKALREARRVAMLDFVEQTSGLYGSAQVARAADEDEDVREDIGRFSGEGRPALIAALRKLLLSEDPEIVTYDDAVEEIERRSKLELSVLREPVTFSEMRKHGYREGKDNPFHWTNLMQVARGDGYFARIIEMDRKGGIGGSPGAVIEMAEWARREGAYDLAGVLLETVKRGSSAKERVWQEAEGILQSLKGEGWHLSDRGADLLAEVGVEAALTIVAAATVGGAVARGAVGLMRLGGAAAKGRNLARLARVLGSQSVQRGVGVVASAQGMTAARLGLNAARGRAGEGYVEASIRDLTAMLALSGMGAIFGRAFAAGAERELRAVRWFLQKVADGKGVKREVVKATEEMAALTFGRPLAALSDAERMYLVMTGPGRAAYRGLELGLQAEAMMHMQALEVAFGLCESCPSEENLGHVTKLLAGMRDLYLIHQGNVAGGRAMGRAVEAVGGEVARAREGMSRARAVREAMKAARELFGFGSMREMTAEGLKRAYKRYAREHHPDRGGNREEMERGIALGRVLIRHRRGEVLTAEEVKVLRESVAGYRAQRASAKGADVRASAKARGGARGPALSLAATSTLDFRSDAEPAIVAARPLRSAARKAASSTKGGAAAASSPTIVPSAARAEGVGSGAEPASGAAPTASATSLSPIGRAAEWMMGGASALVGAPAPMMGLGTRALQVWERLFGGGEKTTVPRRTEDATSSEGTYREMPAALLAADRVRKTVQGNIRDAIVSAWSSPRVVRPLRLRLDLRTGEVLETKDDDLEADTTSIGETWAEVRVSSPKEHPRVFFADDTQEALMELRRRKSAGDDSTAAVRLGAVLELDGEYVERWKEDERRKSKDKYIPSFVQTLWGWDWKQSMAQAQGGTVTISMAPFHRDHNGGLAVPHFGGGLEWYDDARVDFRINIHSGRITSYRVLGEHGKAIAIAASAAPEKHPVMEALDRVVGVQVIPPEHLKFEPPDREPPAESSGSGPVAPPAPSTPPTAPAGSLPPPAPTMPDDASRDLGGALLRIVTGGPGQPRNPAMSGDLPVRLLGENPSFLLLMTARFYDELLRAVSAERGTSEPPVVIVEGPRLSFGEGALPLESKVRPRVIVVTPSGLEGSTASFWKEEAPELLKLLNIPGRPEIFAPEADIEGDVAAWIHPLPMRGGLETSVDDLGGALGRHLREGGYLVVQTDLEEVNYALARMKGYDLLLKKVPCSEEGRYLFPSTFFARGDTFLWVLRKRATADPPGEEPTSFPGAPSSPAVPQGSPSPPAVAAPAPQAPAPRGGAGFGLPPSGLPRKGRAFAADKDRGVDPESSSPINWGRDRSDPQHHEAMMQFADEAARGLGEVLARTAGQSPRERAEEVQRWAAEHFHPRNAGRISAPWTTAQHEEWQRIVEDGAGNDLTAIAHALGHLARASTEAERSAWLEALERQARQSVAPTRRGALVFAAARAEVRVSGTENIADERYPSARAFGEAVREMISAFEAQRFDSTLGGEVLLEMMQGRPGEFGNVSAAIAVGPDGNMMVNFSPRSPSSWNPAGANILFDPRLGELLPRILGDPDSVAPDVQLDAETQEQLQFAAEAVAEDIEAGWRDNGRIITGAEKEEVLRAASSRLGALARLGYPQFLGVGGKEHIQQVAWEMGFPKLMTPVECALMALAGPLIRYARFGVLHSSLKGRVELEHNGLPMEARRWNLGGGFAVEAEPGGHETVAGVDYHLIWEGPFDEGVRGRKIVATVGVIRLPDGFAIVKRQGGKNLSERVVLPGGKVRELSRHAQSWFHGNLDDIGLWLLRQVVRELRREDPAAPLSWLRGDRILWPYNGISVASPVGTSHAPATNDARILAGHLESEQLRNLMEDRERQLRGELSAWESKWQDGKGRLSLKEHALYQDAKGEFAKIERQRRVMETNDKLARRMGFRPDGKEGTWFVLPPDDPAWEALLRDEPMDMRRDLSPPPSPPRGTEPRGPKGGGSSGAPPSAPAGSAPAAWNPPPTSPPSSSASGSAPPAAPLSAAAPLPSAPFAPMMPAAPAPTAPVFAAQVENLAFRELQRKNPAVKGVRVVAVEGSHCLVQSDSGNAVVMEVQRKAGPDDHEFVVNPGSKGSMADEGEYYFPDAGTWYGKGAVHTAKVIARKGDVVLFDVEGGIGLQARRASGAALREPDADQYFFAARQTGEDRYYVKGRGVFPVADVIHPDETKLFSAWRPYAGRFLVGRSHEPAVLLILDPGSSEMRLARNVINLRHGIYTDGDGVMRKAYFAGSASNGYGVAVLRRQGPHALAYLDSSGDGNNIVGVQKTGDNDYRRATDDEVGWIAHDAIPFEFPPTLTDPEAIGHGSIERVSVTTPAGERPMHSTDVEISRGTMRKTIRVNIEVSDEELKAGRLAARLDHLMQLLSQTPMEAMLVKAINVFAGESAGYGEAGERARYDDDGTIRWYDFDSTIKEGLGLHILHHELGHAIRHSWEAACPCRGAQMEYSVGLTILLAVKAAGDITRFAGDDYHLSHRDEWFAEAVRIYLARSHQGSLAEFDPIAVRLVASALRMVNQR